MGRGGNRGTIELAAQVLSISISASLSDTLLHLLHLVRFISFACAQLTWFNIAPFFGTPTIYNSHLGSDFGAIFCFFFLAVSRALLVIPFFAILCMLFVTSALYLNYIYHIHSLILALEPHPSLLRAELVLLLYRLLFCSLVYLLGSLSSAFSLLS